MSKDIEEGQFNPEEPHSNLPLVNPENWKTPRPLGASLSIPEFPVDSLPNWLGNFVGMLAEEIQVPVDLAGMAALSVLSTCCQGKAKVQLWGKFVEPLNLYTLSVARSGSGKSVIFRRMVAPLDAVERRALADYKKVESEYGPELQQLTKTLESSQRSLAQTKDQEKRKETEAAIQKIQKRIAELEAVLLPPQRLIADEVTPEMLTQMMAENEGRMAVLSPEGDFFDILAGRYSSGVTPNLGTVLKAHSCDPIRVDRVKRGSDVIPEPALTLGISTQPIVLAGLAANKSFAGRGLLARLLYTCPPDLLGFRDTDQPATVPDEVEEQYHREIEALLFATPENDPPALLPLMEEAQDAFLDLRAQLEDALRPGGELGHMADWGGKLVGTVARLAGLLHLAHHPSAGVPWGEPISRETAAKAVDIAIYLEAHAKLAFSAMTEPLVVTHAKILQAVLKTHITTKGKGYKVTSTELLNYGRAYQVGEVELEAAVTLLNDYGYIAKESRTYPPEVEKEKGTWGADPDSYYWITPRIVES